MASIPVTRTTTTTARPVARRSRPRSRTNVASMILGRLAMFLSLAAITYLVSSLFGQVMLENARREGITSQRRAVEAKRAEVTLRARINELTGFSNLEGWAVAHGFVAPNQPTLSSGDVTRVAQLDR